MQLMFAHGTPTHQGEVTHTLVTLVANALENEKNIAFFKCMLRHGVVRDLCRAVC